MKHDNKLNSTQKKGNIDDVNVEISVSVPTHDLPIKAIELADTYGTYEIQNTADTENQYPAIAQGFNSKIIKHDCENPCQKNNLKNEDK